MNFWQCDRSLFDHPHSHTITLGGSTEISSHTRKLRGISDQRYLSKLTKTKFLQIWCFAHLAYGFFQIKGSILVYGEGPRWVTWTASWCDSVTECSHGLWSGDSTFHRNFSQIPDINNNYRNFHISQEFLSKILTSSTPTWTFSSLTIPAGSSHLLQHRLGGVKSSLVCVCQGGANVPKWPILTVVLTMCVFPLMWWPYGCGCYQSLCSLNRLQV